MTFWKKEFETITFQNFIDLIKQVAKSNGLPYSYEYMEEMTDINHKKSQRTYKRNNGTELQRPNYSRLFDLLEDTCEKAHCTKADPLVNEFTLPEHYRDFSYEYLKKIVIDVLRDETSPSEEAFHNTKDFIMARINDDKKITKISMCFYTGWDWIRSGTNKNELIKEIFKDSNIDFFIIVNHRVAADKIASTMTNPDDRNFYTGYKQAILRWNAISSEFKNINFRISDLPLLKKMCIIDYEDGSCEILFRNYVYNLYNNSGKEQTLVRNDSEWLEIYKEEFKYLWNKGLTFAKWNATYNATIDEEAPDKDYVMVHFPDKSSVMVSSLHINKKSNWLII